MSLIVNNTPAAGDTRRADDADVLTQVAALCTRQGKKGTKVLVVKSSRGRWILPKGWPMDDCTDAQAAKREAWEEAGVQKGTIGKTPVGSYLTQKRFDDGRVSPCLVTVYPLAVKSMTNTYPEAGMRRRKWMSVGKAIKKLDDPGLVTLLLRLYGPLKKSRRKDA